MALLWWEGPQASPAVFRRARLETRDPTLTEVYKLLEAMQHELGELLMRVQALEEQMQRLR